MTHDSPSEDAATAASPVDMSDYAGKTAAHPRNGDKGRLRAPSSSWVSARLTVPCDRLGFSAPPMTTRLQFLGSPGRRTILVDTPPGEARQITSWLLTLDPVAIRFTPPEDPNHAHVDLIKLPDPLESVLMHVHVREARCEPDGEVALTVEGERRDLRRLMRVPSDAADQFSVEALRAVHVRTVTDDLTGPQREALDAALAAGYYDVPRRIRLRELAAEMGTSAAALSERLRRAEAKLVRRYIRDDLHGGEAHARRGNGNGNGNGNGHASGQENSGGENGNNRGRYSRR